MTFAALVVLGYLLGSCPWGYWLVRLVKHEDIRRAGSGNIGATNVWRTYGRWLGAPVVLLDVLKGFVPALLGMLYVPPHYLSAICAGAAAMLGHWRPIFLRFAKGGKMVATCGGVFIGVAPLVALTAGLVWLVVFLTSRYASLASILAGIALPVSAAIYGDPNEVIVFGVAAAAAICFLHRANLRRLRAGTESRFQLRRKPARDVQKAVSQSRSSM
jgi:glycerol-3-phosphate acyltransferase PlsY